MLRTTSLRQILLIGLLTFLITSQTDTASAGTNTWTSNGPEGRIILALAIDPTTPNTLYAGTLNGGVFKSTNGGGSWSAVNNGLASTTIYALAIDLTTPSTIYAGGSGVFKSTNGGGNWSSVNNGLTCQSVHALAIVPTFFSNSGTLYAGTSCGVFKSYTLIEYWSHVLGSGDVHALAIDPTTPSTLYAGIYNGGVVKSTNSGAAWSAVNNGLPLLYISALAIDPMIPSTIYGKHRRVQEHERRRELERGQHRPDQYQ